MKDNAHVNNLFYLCIKNKDCPDLEIRKVYHGVDDPVVGKHGQIRIIDESGEDYLYPQEYFLVVELPKEAERFFELIGQ